MKPSHNNSQVESLSALPPRSAQNSIILALGRDRDLTESKEKPLRLRRFLSSLIDATPFREIGTQSSVSIAIAPSGLFVYDCNYFGSHQS
jgi:hypothetical protein